MAASDDAQRIETQLLADLNGGAGTIADSLAYAAERGIDHAALVGAIRSLASSEMVVVREDARTRWVLTSEAKSYVEHGSPEAQVFRSVKAAMPQGLAMSALRAQIGAEAAAIGFKQAMQLRWVAVQKKPKPAADPAAAAAPPDPAAKGAGKKKKAPKEEPVVLALAEEAEDVTRGLLVDVSNGAAVGDKEAQALKKRKLVQLEKTLHYAVSRGPKFALERKKQATDLTRDMLVGDAWRDLEFKKYNFAAMGADTLGGHLHPLLKVRTQFRKIFVGMGFEEMPTNRFVESSFWNFDALFQPQQHPARDAHDTFFITRPSKTPHTRWPSDYVQRVCTTHEEGGYGSLGYGYNWKVSEAEKNILRTHTTAVSSRMLYLLAEDYRKEGKFTPKRYFSIDRVFRNETLDRTHLAEFHQCEGLVAGKGLSLAHLIGTISTFFKKIGMPDVKFKPAYNPYTEPSMEIFAFHPGLGKYMEVGNSGVFRPEMLRPMGLPEDVNVVAWGLGLERPTMILYGVPNIRELFGHKVDLHMMRTNPVCRIGLEG